MSVQTLDDLAMAGKRVLTRLDLNLPLDDGRITDATRLARALPTLRAILDAGGTPLILSHFGRPKGVRNPDYSLAFAVEPLADAIGAPVVFAEDCIGEAAAEAATNAPAGALVLLENTRFHAGEEQNDPAFAQALAALGDLYVNDAFSAAHRAHASTEGLAHLRPAAAGRAMQAELDALSAALSSPERPVVAVVGGAKISTKLDLLGNLLDRVDALVIGGGMANTFLAARGVDVGKSLCEHEMLDAARTIMDRAEAAQCAILLPIDIVVARDFKAHAPHETLPAEACPADAMILDAGPQTVANIAARFEQAKTIVWNGPLGAFEIAPFNAATNAAANMAAKLAASGRVRAVAGGGDTVAALNAAGATERFTYVSTAGGAFLEWLEGKTLPGVAALQK